VVPLIGRHRDRGAEALDAPLTAFRTAATRLPERDSSPLDRMFALECLARAGRDARAVRERLLPARRAAEEFIDEQWEPDVPHVAVLGQAIAALHALDDDPPRSWPPLLEQTLVELSERQARLGIASDPLLLAGVIRGLAAADLPLRTPLLDAARSYFEQRPTAAGAAELAEALVRHPSGRELARHAAEIVFSERHAADPGAAIARWWLADRWADIVGEEVAGNETTAAARAQAVAGPVPDSSRLAAMLAEVAGRGVESLVLFPAAKLELIRAAARGRALIENYAWRTLLVLVLATLAVFYIRDIVGWFGVEKPKENLLTAATVTIVTIAAAAVVFAVKAAFRRTERKVPAIFDEAQWVVPVVAALIALFIRS
jgi:hypothetical protein